jgi:hypothetical protein
MVPLLFYDSNALFVWNDANANANAAEPLQRLMFGTNSIPNAHTQEHEQAPRSWKRHVCSINYDIS